MNTRHLEVFYAIMVCGSISRAADMLHISQPAVSKTLKHAEMRLGYLLFERTRGKLIPTKEARILYDKAQMIYQELSDFQLMAENLAEKPRGNISIGCLPSLGLSLIPEVTKLFLERYPQSRVEVSTYHTDELIHLLNRYQLDFAISFRPIKEQGISSITLAKIPVVYLDAEPLEQGVMSLEAIDDDRWINPGADSLSTMIHQYRTFKPTQLNVHTYYMAAEFVKRRVGCTISDLFSAAEVLPFSMIYPLKEPMMLDLCMLYQSDRPLRKISQDYQKLIQKFLNRRLKEYNQKLYLPR
ncbi:LysR family transcriptional regulator [Ignatzschineria indica]|uniref:LysR family transcriptional regulator n=1 Tax=Ignatzschineria indica TaxID=472583 RepID=A0A2U2AIS4_9GAMM|nr:MULTISPECIES: LysR family transcriptional regulator [Ignatzschineria]MDM1545336.1 LysR family transcriptional regulator [Ignatzschineria indica]OYQ80664.1 LysR family transcriptional regulator [Ignatzschineria sp. F8392]PWD82564.1 LysR family transcriptional regulator [Ignatzschineria indica]GGZ84971.1 LysR family transcriptional regulator [Ignatzschineria indica]